MRKSLNKVLASLLVFGMSLSLSTTALAQAEIMKGEELEKIELDKDAKEKVLVIDVRPEEEYKEGHLKHAINMPLDTLKDELGRLEDFKEKDIIVYCNTGKKSAEAAQLLMDNGFTKVKDAQGVKDFEYTLVTYENILMDEFIEKTTDDVETLFIDARKPEDFAKDSVKDAISGDPEKPEAILEQLPEDKNAEIITYCYSGNRSAVIAEHLTKEGYTNVFNSLDGTKENDKLPVEAK